MVLATDAPLLPHQCDRLAQRAGLGVARTGGGDGNTSGDIFLAFATGNAGVPPEHGSAIPLRSTVEMLANVYLSDLLAAAIEATEAAIVNALLAAETMVGRDGIVAHGLDRARAVGDHGALRPAPGYGWMMPGRDWDTIAPVVTSKIVMFPSTVRRMYCPRRSTRRPSSFQCRKLTLRYSLPSSATTSPMR